MHPLAERCRPALLEPHIGLGRQYGRLLYGLRQLAHLPLLLLHTPHTLPVGQTNGIGQRREALVGIVLPQQYAILGPRGEHTVGLVNPLGHQVVNQHSDIGLRTPEDERSLAAELQHCVDASHQPLAGGLLVARGTVDLASKIEVLHPLGLKCIYQLRRREVVILNGIARLEDAGLLKTLDTVQRLELHLDGQRRRESVEVPRLRPPALGFDKQLVVVLVSEALDLVLNGGAVARSTTLDAAGEKRRAREAGAQDVVRAQVGIGQVAGTLLGEGLRVGERELGWMLVARLLQQLREIYGAAVDAHGGARLEALHLEAHVTQLVRETHSRRLPHPAATPRVGADIDGSIEESAVGEHHGLCRNGVPHTGDNTRHHPTVAGQGHHLVLPEGQVGQRLEHLTPIE